MLTAQEVEMLATLLARAGANAYEIIWANSIMDRLRALAAAEAQRQEASPELINPTPGAVS